MLFVMRKQALPFRKKLYRLARKLASLSVMLENSLRISPRLLTNEERQMPTITIPTFGGEVPRAADAAMPAALSLPSC